MNLRMFTAAGPLELMRGLLYADVQCLPKPRMLTQWKIEAQLGLWLPALIENAAPANNSATFYLIMPGAIQKKIFVWHTASRVRKHTIGIMI